jgi:hypothetical protein
MAWDEQPVAVRSEFASLVEELASMKRPIAATSQLVHGDLTGNVLFSEGLAPGIIDLSLYWRPPGYAAPSWLWIVLNGRVWEPRFSTMCPPFQGVNRCWSGQLCFGSCGLA